MTRIIDKNPKRLGPVRTAARFAVFSMLLFGTLVASAHAEDRHGWGDRGRGNWNRGYYAPPVVYGAPYYYPPPVVYGPGIGINLPFVSIGVR